jgi:RNA polymerase sigma-70 factor (ECF subfamily)
MTQPGQLQGLRAHARGLTADAFAAEFTAAAGVLWTVAAGVLGGANAVEDILQEAALIGLQKRSHFEPGTSFVAWTARIVRFVAQNHRRRERRRRTSCADPGDLDVQQPAPAISAPVHDDRGDLLPDTGAFDDALRGALQSLRPVPRACVVLKLVAGLDYDAIARLLGIPAGTAMSHVHRSRSALLATLSPKETPR